MESIRPWCISRQLWWGHRLPVYYCERCDADLRRERSAPERCARLRRARCARRRTCSTPGSPRRSGRLRRSAGPQTRPQLQSLLPDQRALHRARHPLPVGRAHDHDGPRVRPARCPSHDVYIHSIIQAPDGRRMSKSLGTGIDPLEEIDAHGADAVRFGLLAMSSTQDVRYSAEKVQQGQALANKLFNATRAVRCSRARPEAVAAGAEPAHASRTAGSSRAWRVNEAQAGARIEAYDFSHAALGLYDFVYGELCDWYLELVKPRLARRRPTAGAPRALGATLAPRPARDGRARASRHPVRDRGAVVAPGGAEGLLAAGAYPRAHASLTDAAGRGRARATRSRRSSRARLARLGRGARRRQRSPRGCDAEGYDETARLARAARAPRLAARASTAPSRSPPCPMPGGTSRSSPARASTWRPPSGAGRRAQTARARRSRASEGKLAKSGFVRTRRRTSSHAEREQLAAPARGAADAVSWRLELRATPSGTCARSSCSACASASTACAA